MKFTQLKAGFVAAFALFAFSQTAFATEERVVATVDGYPIMHSQVVKALGKKQDTEVNRKAAIDSLIDDILIRKATEQAGINVSRAYIDQVIEDMVVKNGITYGQFLDYLDYQGISLEQYRKQITDQIIKENVKQFAVSQSVKVEPEDVQKAAAKMLEEAKANGKLKTVTSLEHRVSHILLKTTPILNDMQAKAKLSTIVADIHAGKTTFEEAAKNHSVDYASGAEGGDLGWNFLDVYDPAFAQTAQKSPTNVISAPFRSQFGWHILKVTDTRQADRTEDAYLQRAYEQLLNKQVESASKDWVKALRNGVEIKYY